MVSVRILGKSKVAEIECLAIIFATGDNLTLLGDMTRCAILCTLDAGVEQPELREFTVDSITRILEDRSRYVAAAILIAAPIVRQDRHESPARTPLSSRSGAPRSPSARAASTSAAPAAPPS